MRKTNFVGIQLWTLEDELFTFYLEISVASFGEHQERLQCL